MIDQFTVGFKAQRSWGSLAAVDFFLGGTGAGAFIWSMYFGVPAGMIIGWMAVVLGAVALLVDLGRPGRFLRASSQIGRSWISRGVVFTSVFLVSGILRIASEMAGGLAWGGNTGPGQAIGLVAAAGALGVMLYTGFLLSQSPSIPFWNTTMLPLLFALYALTCGLGVILVLLPVIGEQAADLRSIQIAGIALTAISLVSLWGYLLSMSSSTVAARESVRLLTSGQLALPFLLGVNLVGLVLPLAAIAIAYLSGAGFGDASAVMAVAGVLALTGGYLFRHSMLKAGVYPPVIDL